MRTAIVLAISVSVVWLSAWPRAASAQEGTELEYIGTVVTSAGTVLVGAGSDDGAYPCVHISVTQGAENPKASPNACFPTLDVRAWVLRVADSLAALTETPHRGRARGFGGNPVVHLGTGTAAGMMVQEGPASSAIFGLMVMETRGDDTFSIWLTLDDAKKLIVFIGRASDRSIDMSPEFALRDSYRRIFPRPDQ